MCIPAYVSARSCMDFLILFKSENDLYIMVTSILMYLNVSENVRTEIQFIVDNLFESPYLVLLEKVCLKRLRCFGIMLIILCKMNRFLYKSFAEIVFLGDPD